MTVACLQQALRTLWRYTEVLLIVCVFNSARASAESAFCIEGTFEETIQNAHHNGGRFTVEAFGNKAIVDMTFETNVRQIVGSDGTDSFFYIPYRSTTGEAGHTNGIAAITAGRFPKEADFPLQLLWLASTYDPELLESLPTMRFPFYGSDTTNNLKVHMRGLSGTDRRPTTIGWYLSPESISPSGARSRLALYPEGQLTADLVIVCDEISANVRVPKQIVFTHYHGYAARSLQEFRSQAPRKPEDVYPDASLIFTVTKSRLLAPRRSYIPEFPDPTALVHDRRRTTGIVTVQSGQWWRAGELMAQNEARFTRGRLLTVIVVALLAAIPLYLLSRRSVGNTGTH